MLVFLTTLQRKKKLWPFILPLILLSLISTGYVKIFYDDLVLRVASNTTVDIIIGIIIVIMVLEATRQAMGYLVPVLVSLFIVYAFICGYLPPPFHHFPFTLERLVTLSSIGFSGVYGMFLGISSRILVFFLLFGGLLEVTGVNQFFLEIGKATGSKLRSGPAQTAVISSSLVGTVTGASVSNVALTGSFTIPLMKKVGYKPENAGAIEAAASSGGQILPPIMGIAAFLMAGIIGVPYVKICAAAVIPALLYYLGVGTGVELLARKMKFRMVEGQKIDTGIIKRRAHMFVIPIATIIIILVMGYSAMLAGFAAVICLLALSFIVKDTRLTPRKLMEGFRRGAYFGAQLAVSGACLGVMVMMLSVTGLGIMIGNTVEAWSGGMVFVAVFITMIVSIILGCGAPTPAAYILVAVVTAPVLVRLGIGLMEAHLFVFYFAIFSSVTPPLAMAALVASRIAESNYIRTALEACRLAFPAFIIPWMLIYNPAIIGRFEDPISGTISLLGVIFLVIAVEIASFGQLFTSLSLWERSLFGISALGFIAYLTLQNYMGFAIGLVLLILLVVYQWRKRNQEKYTTPIKI